MKTFKDAIEIARVNHTTIEEIAERVKKYYRECNERKWSSFRFAKRWNKIYENIVVFLSDNSLNQKFEDMARWNNKQKKETPSHHKIGLNMKEKKIHTF